MSATLATLASFSGPDGANPEDDLIADSGGNLLGTTLGGGADDDGTVFEIKKTASGYASTPTTLVGFSGANGSSPISRLVADADGDLFGVTQFGGANGDGTVFEIAKTATGYASILATLVSFSGADGANPEDALLADSNGDLFGTTSSGGANNHGTVFEIAETAGGYASTPNTLLNFNSAASPAAGLIADSNGDLFGTTQFGGPLFLGTVFEIKKTAAGYATAPATLVSFNGGDGSRPFAGLIADANGDLFGTTSGLGPNGLPFPPGAGGTVFEIKNTAGGYASAPSTLVSFNVADGENPEASLIADANGDLFGTTGAGGANNDGTVFEIKKTAAGYASAPTTLVSFNGSDGASPLAGLTADASGDLFGTTSEGGPSGDGTVFEITNSGFVPAGSVVTPASDGILFWNTDGQAAIWGMDGTNMIAGGPVNPNPGPSWYTVGTGDFNDDGLPDLLWQNNDGQAAIWEMNGTSRIGAVGTGDFNDDGHSDILWQNASTGQASVWEMNGTSRTGGGAVSPSPGPSWYAVGTGDFNDDGHSDILWQNASTGQASIWEMNGASRIGGGAVNPNPGPSWRAIGTGDFNDDGHSDILWQNDDGQAAIWEMNGASRIGGGAVNPNPGPSWRAIGTGDFNDDGHSDILWQNASTGQASIWEMNGSSRIGGGAVTPNPGASWFAVGIGDFNGDGHSDILWQNTSWQVAIWDMNGTTRIGGGAVNANPGPSWYAIGLT
jgi:uncharacterized repeat protein (TIGR03803 family)